MASKQTVFSMDGVALRYGTYEFPTADVTITVIDEPAFPEEENGEQETEPNAGLQDSSGSHDSVDK